MDQMSFPFSTISDAPPSILNALKHLDTTTMLILMQIVRNDVHVR